MPDVSDISSNTQKTSHVSWPNALCFFFLCFCLLFLFTPQVDAQTQITTENTATSIEIAPSNHAHSVASEKKLGVGIEEWIRMIGSLLFVIALIFGLAWAIKQLQSKTLPKNGDMHVLSSITLGSKERLLKIQVEEKRYLIAISPSGIQKIAELNDE